MKLFGKVFTPSWIKNGDGHSDAVLTMAWLGFLVVLFRVIIAEFSFNIAGHQYGPVKMIDPLVIAAILGPTLGAYITNHYNNMKSNPFYKKLMKDIDGDGKEEEVLVPAGEPDAKSGK